jgi:hypothetical protein
MLGGWVCDAERTRSMFKGDYNADDETGGSWDWTWVWYDVVTIYEYHDTCCLSSLSYLERKQ